MSYWTLPKGLSYECELGRAIYLNALDDRLGFRYDQIGIEDEDIWIEIFEHMGKEALKFIRDGEPRANPFPRQAIRRRPNHNPENSEGCAVDEIISELRQAADLSPDLMVRIMAAVGLTEADTIWQRILVLLDVGVSLDAAVALAARLGFQELEIQVRGHRSCAWITGQDQHFPTAATPALALVIAILTAWGERQG